MLLQYDFYELNQNDVPVCTSMHRIDGISQDRKKEGRDGGKQRDNSPQISKQYYSDMDSALRIIFAQEIR